jgi:hypothetical protein
LRKCTVGAALALSCINKRYYLWLSEGRGFSPAAHGRRVEWAFRP